MAIEERREMIRKNEILRILWLAKKFWFVLTVRAMASVGLVLCDIFIPLVMADLLNQVIYGENIGYINQSIPGIMLLMTVRIVMMLLGVSTWGYLESHLMVELRKETLRKIVHMRMDALNTYTVGQLLQILNDDLSQFMQILIRNISNTVVYSVYCCLLVFALIEINFSIAIVCIGIAGFNIAIGRYFGQKARKESEKCRKEQGDYKNWIIDHVEGIEETENLKIENSVRKEFRNIIARYTEKVRRRNLSAAISPAAYELMSDLAKIIVYLLGAYMVWLDRINAGEIVACISYCTLLYIHLNKLLNIRVDYTIRKIYIQNVFQLWETPQENFEKGEELPVIQNLTAEHIAFGYEPDKKLLKNLNLSLNRGDVVNVLGENGEGKSTIFYLFYRLFTEKEGTIRINGKKIDIYKLESLRNQIGIVAQKSGFLSGVFREVITSGCKKKRNEAEIRELLDQVNLSQRVNALPLGMDTYIEDFEKIFSTGEIQRLLLINILLRECQIILLDEVTSHVDQEMEVMLYKFLEKYFKDSIIINISHKKIFTGMNVRTYKLEQGVLTEV